MAVPKDAQDCLNELKEYVEKFLEGNLFGEDIYKIIDEHLFSLACYMRRDDKTYTGLKNIGHTNSDITNAILDGVRDIRKTLHKNPAPLTKKLDKKINSWLGKHNGRKVRYLAVSSKKCGGKADLKEAMPAYMLEAITKEKPAHPKYGNLRY